MDAIMECTPIQARDFKAAGTFTIESLSAGVPTREYVLIPSSAKASSPLSNVSVRQATEYAIDKKAIVESLFYGFGVVTSQANRPRILQFALRLTF